MFHLSKVNLRTERTHAGVLSVKPVRDLNVRPEIKTEFLHVCREPAVAAVGYQPHGTLQMVNRPVTIGTINDYMHKRNGQKQEQHPQRAEPDGPKARVLWIWKWLAVVMMMMMMIMMVIGMKQIPTAFKCHRFTSG